MMTVVAELDYDGDDDGMDDDHIDHDTTGPGTSSRRRRNLRGQ